MKQDLSIIKDMIKSSDKDSRYLGLSILRYNEGNLFSVRESKKLIKSLPITERIINFSDVCYELNITEESCLIFKEPKTKEERCFNALNKIFKIAECYNSDKPIKNFPNFKDGSQYKYFPYYTKDNGGSWLVHDSVLWNSDSYLPASAYFNNEENCNDAMNKFIDIFSEYLM